MTPNDKIAARAYKNARKQFPDGSPGELAAHAIVNLLSAGPLRFTREDLTEAIHVLVSDIVDDVASGIAKQLGEDDDFWQRFACDSAIGARYNKNYKPMP
jgi:hypothetical protein